LKFKGAYGIYFCSKVGEEVAWIFIPLLGVELGLSYLEIGVVMAAYQIGNALSYSFFGWLSDTLNRRKPFIVLGCFLSTLAMYSHLLISDLPSMLFARTFAGLALGAAIYPLVAYVSSSKGYERFISLLNAAGSAGWLVGSLIAGSLSEYELIFKAALICFAAALVLSLLIEESTEISVRDKAKVSFLEVVRRGKWLYTSYYLRHFAASNIWAVFPIFLANLGANKFWIGILYSLNCGVQVFSMNLAGYLAERLKVEKLLVQAGIGLSTLVFTAYWLATNYLQLIPIQVMLGFAWGFLYTGSLIYLVRRNPVERATATGFLGSTISIASITGSFLGGVIAEVLTPSGNALVGALIAMSALLISLKL